MAERIKLVQGDTGPNLVCTLTDESSGLPINIMGATPRLKFRAQGSATVLETLVGSIGDGVNGICVIPWSDTALTGEPGLYEGEIEITFADGTVQTVYDTLKFILRKQF
jgi:hypothetical protein